MNERELLAQRDALMTQARDLNTKAETEARDLTADEQATWDKLQSDIKALDGRIARSRQLAAIPGKIPAAINGRGDSFVNSLKDYFRDGEVSDELRAHMNGKEVTFRASNNTDMNIGTPADGGYVDPTGLYNAVIAKRTEMSLPERLGVQVIPGKGTTINVPYDDEADGEFVIAGEGSGFDQDAPALGQAAMTLVKYTKYLTLSIELIEDEDAGLMPFLTNWIARAQAKTLNQLLLAEVASAGTSFKTTASATAIAAGELEAVVYNDTIGDFLDDSGSVAWVMRPSIFGKIKSITGNPRLYGDFADDRRTVLEYPVHFSNKSGLATAGLKSAYFGNWNFVGWRMPGGFSLLRDPYSAASTGQVKLWLNFRTVFKVLQPSAIGYLIQHT